MRQPTRKFHTIVTASLLSFALFSLLSGGDRISARARDGFPLPGIGPEDGESDDGPLLLDPDELVAADPAPNPADPAPSDSEMDALFAELAQIDGEGWHRAQLDILRIWSRSGSLAMDLLYRRGEAALDAGDLESAIGHLTALTDHAPDFAAGWQLRAVAFYLDGETGPAIADLARALALEPRHFTALTQLGTVFEEIGHDRRALAAYRQSLKINPHQQEATDAVRRLEQKTAGTDA